VAKWLNHLVGLIMPDTEARRDVAPTPPPARMIFGGTAAPELCMLPVETALPDDNEKRVAQIKVDGINAMYVDNRIVGGREGGPLDCALHCQPALQRLEEHIGHPMVFFGEYSAHDGFNPTLGEYRSGKGDGVFWIYDAIPHGAWVNGQDYLVPIESRLESLRTAFQAAETGLFVGFLDWWMLTPAETRAKALEIFAGGYEGLVSKKSGSPYRRRRHDDWRKVKERFTVPCQVVDSMRKHRDRCRPHRQGQFRTHRWVASHDPRCQI
jgi:hypothetical protein